MYKGSPVSQSTMPSTGVFQFGMGRFGPALNPGRIGKEQAVNDPRGKGVDRSNQFGPLQSHGRMDPKRPPKHSAGSCSGVNTVASSSNTTNNATNSPLNNPSPIADSDIVDPREDGSIIDEKTPNNTPAQSVWDGMAANDVPGQFGQPDGELGHEHFLGNVAGPGPEIVEEGESIFDSYLDTNDPMFDDMRGADGELWLFPGAPMGNYCPGPDDTEF